MKSTSVIDRILEGGIICAVGSGIETSQQAMKTIEAVTHGGLSCFEIMLVTPDATSLLGQLRKRHPDVIFGIGTVLDTETASKAVGAGASFLVSPYLNMELIRFCKRHGVVSCFGALTPTEIMKGWEAGLDLVKVFPTAAMGGVQYIRTLKGPFPQMRLVAAGGIRLDDVEEYFRAGASLIAVDEDLMNPEKIGKGDFAAVTNRAREYRAVLDKRESFRKPLEEGR